MAKKQVKISYTVTFKGCQRVQCDGIKELIYQLEQCFHTGQSLTNVSTIINSKYQA